MTAEIIIDTVEEQDEKGRANNNSTETAAEVEIGNGEVSTEIGEIFEFLSKNQKIIFKSQQIDDPELQRAEKVQIAREIYARNRQTFLMRFGSYFEERHLEVFARKTLSTEAMPALRADENGEEMEFLLLDYQRKLQTRTQDVKNRRYAALQQLIEKGEYFSEQEMMKRAPELYQELIGQYLSELEKKERDSYDVRNTTFSGILMHTMEQREIDDVLKKADKQNQHKDEVLEEDPTPPDQHSEEHSASSSDDNECASNIEEEQTISTILNKAARYDDEVPMSFRQQWGNFDNEQVACSTSRVATSHSLVNPERSTGKTIPVTKAETKYIASGERELLRQEFLGIMHEKFLSGQDEDFDYSQVDDNSQLDDLRQLNQDKEDAYFEESDEEDFHGGFEDNAEQMQELADESEDELDIYMSHLSKHHSLQK